MEAMEKMMMLKGFEALMSEVAAMPASGFTLKGKVTDSATGARVFGAVIELVGTSVSYVTSPTGYFKFQGLAEGLYLMRVSVPGFAAADLVVCLSDTDVVDINVALEVPN